MFRKFLLIAVASLGLLSPLAVTSADARDFHHDRYPGHHREYHHDYRVWYRESCHREWRFGGEFHSRYRAEQVAEDYRCHGCEVSIR